MLEAGTDLQIARLRVSTVSNTTPFTDAHAIARLDFALIFKKDLTDDERAQLALELQAHLDQFNRVEADNDDEGDEPSIAFDRTGEDDEVTESVHIHGNYVHVVWSDYRGWSFSRDSAIGYFQPVLKWVREGRLALSSISLVYRDVFFNETPDTYSASEVLKMGGQYVAQKIFSSGPRWRHWLAWRNSEAESLPVVTYATLRIEADVVVPTGDDNASFHCTEIIHSQNLRWRDDALLTAPSDEELRKAWNSAHGANHALIQELITDDMLERIGLKEGSNERPLPH